MLIEFSVMNYRSIKDRQTLSMVASSKSDKNYFETKAPNDFKILRTSVIYGANAAGKSNIIKAMRCMNIIIGKSASMQEGDDLNITPFLFDSDSRDGPTEFEVVFIVGGVKYQYGFIASSTRIFEESLIAFPKGRAQHWFSRLYDVKSGEYKYKCSDHLLGQKSVWQNATRQNALFLSTAVQLNSTQLKPILNWFKEQFVPVDITGMGDSFSTLMCSEEKTKNQIVSFLKSADISIQDISIQKEKFNADLISDEVPEEVKKRIILEMKDEDIYDIKTVHQGNNGSTVHLDLDEESDGTQKLYAISGPVIDSIKDGNILVVDELHANLHPKIVKYIVDIFNNKKTNPNNAQLIFSTHETSILNEEVFTPDQVWFCDKNKNQETSLYSLSEFKTRKGRINIEFSYLAGRFGAIPFVEPFELGY